MYSKEEISMAFSGTKRTERYTDEMREKILSTKCFDKALSWLREENEASYKEALPEEAFSLFRMYAERGSRNEFMSVYWKYRRKLMLNAISAYLYGEERDIHGTEDVLWSVLNEYSWTPPVHITAYDGVNKRNVSLEENVTDNNYIVDLLSAETAASIAECLLILGDKLHPLIVKRAVYELDRRIFTPYLEKRFAWEVQTNNWLSVCASNIALAALAVVDDEERLTAILHRALLHIERYISGFNPDGACLEGVAYWDYGFGPFTNLACKLNERTCGAIDLFSIEKIEAVARAYYKCFFVGGRAVNFSDCRTCPSISPTIHSVLMRRYSDLAIPRELVSLSGPLSNRLHEAVRFFTEITDDYAEQDGKIFGTHIFPDSQWYISSSENGVGIAAKGGNNDEPHNHNDIGSFLVYKNGVEIISDIGAGEYVKGYFDDARYDFFATSSRGHSLPIVNGGYQKDGAEFFAEDVVLTQNGISCDISRAYANEDLKKLVRKISFDTETGAVTLTDSFELKAKPISLVERFVTASDARFSDDGIVIGDEKEKMILSYDSALVRPHIAKAELGGFEAPKPTTVIDFEPLELSECFTFQIKIHN